MPTIHNILKCALSPAATLKDRASFVSRNDSLTLTVACEGISHKTKTIEASGSFGEAIQVGDALDLTLPSTVRPHLPCVTPTFEQVWLEGAAHGTAGRVGAMVFRHDLRSWKASTLACRFVCSVFPFFGYNDRVYGGGRVNLLLGSDGHCVRRSQGDGLWCAVSEWALWCTLHALCKIHCKNVTVEPAKQGESSWLAGERAVKRMSEWHTIKVRPVHRSSAELQDAGEPTITRLRSVAGHYADYRQNGLFGRHRGIYWFPERQYGDADLGEVVPQYEVA